MPRLEARNLSKTFGDFAAVSDVSLAFEPGRIHAVLGENGAGKSTLMKLLFGLHVPSAGKILIDGQSVQFQSSMDAIRRGLGMVQQHFTLVRTLSAVDNIMLGAEPSGTFGRLRREQAIRHLESVLPSRALAVPWDAKVSDLSVGQRQRIEILKLLFRDARILFLDEPTAVLTPAEIDEFFEVLRKLKGQGRTIVLITHKINEVQAICDDYLILRGGRVQAQGPVAGVSAEDIVEKMIGRKLPAFELARRSFGTDSVLTIENIKQDSVLDGASLNVNKGEIVGIAGVEGSGQSQLVNAVMGLAPFSGRIRLLGEEVQPFQTRRVRELGTGLVPEDRLEQGLWPDESCYNNMMIGLEDRFLRHGIFQWKLLRDQTSEWAKTFDVRASSLEVPTQTLSGGNQQKVIFAREVSGRRPRLLICHQPTRGVDLGAIDLIHRRMIEMRNEGLGVLVLSSDLDELLKLCDRIYVMFSGRVSGQFPRAEFDRLKIGAAMTGAMHA